MDKSQKNMWSQRSKKYILLWFYFCEIQEYAKLISLGKIKILVARSRWRGWLTPTRDPCRVTKRLWVLTEPLVTWDLHIYQNSSDCTLKALALHCLSVLPQLFTKVLQSFCAFWGYGWRKHLGCQSTVGTIVVLVFFLVVKKPSHNCLGNTDLNRGFMCITGFMWGKELI